MPSAAQTRPLVLLLCTLAACGGTATSTAGGTDGAGGAGGTGGNVRANPVPDDTRDFLATELNFYYPEGIGQSTEVTTNPCGLDAGTDNTMYEPLIYDEVVVTGFDMDGTVSSSDEGLCGQADFPGTDGGDGVDYAFLHVIDMIRPIRPDQIARGVLAQAPSEGLINFGIRLSGVDDLENDDSVEVLVITTIEPPQRGTDGRIIPLSSVTIDPTPEWRTTFNGRIVDGVLTTEPADFVLGDIDLLVIFDRVIRLSDARLRATFIERDNGVIEVDGLLSGWWSRENMLHAISQVVTAIGANDGELACAFDTWADRSTDGETCDSMSMIFKVGAVSGFLTDFETAEE
jgi:hypothetical protein